ncbi:MULTISPECIES: DUF2285 domain-containing protein [unclassified Novosphingobium]|uniref:DUF2285 domain-containing protein n=1 Tax=unclassified Novosphingobium TaxID=2644732 RepID=UPI00146A1628|nr:MULTISPECIES: DUF2285 domain-containing protein [unclassified Novosphingobium]NMN07529.1 hypothetical protein [Novosphingobium sp. SG919]NMN89868.1 hypothetical protein [Novosphingobium sp. SG916]
MPVQPFLDVAPFSANGLTSYDLDNLNRYLRLLDGDSGSFASWQEAVEHLFGIDPAEEPERARRVYDSHLARAEWLVQVGYRALAAMSMGSDTRT